MHLKLKLVLTFLLLAVSNFTYSQVAWETQGNSIGATDFLGTTNTQPLVLKTTNTTTAQPIIFSTNATEQMRLLANGNLGLGTSAPAHLLDVSGGDINLSTGQGLRINGKIVLAHDALILKATDADAYFRITVYSLGQLKATAL